MSVCGFTDIRFVGFVMCLSSNTTFHHNLIGQLLMSFINNLH